MTEDIYLFKALGEETKQDILKTLLNEEVCACDISKKINKKQANTSMHLSKLLEWKLVKCRRDGKSKIYSLNDPKIKKILEVVEKIK